MIGILKSLGMTARVVFRKPVTIQYPTVHREIPNRRKVRDALPVVGAQALPAIALVPAKPRDHQLSAHAAATLAPRRKPGERRCRHRRRAGDPTLR